MSTSRTNGFQSSFGTIVQINIKLLVATGMVFFAYLAWPSSLAWVGLWIAVTLCRCHDCDAQCPGRETDDQASKARHGDC